MSSIRRIAKGGLAALVLFVVAEIAVRLSGLTDFPIYRADNVIGYIPAPSQSGDFLNRHHWRFNELSMGAGTFAPSPTVQDTLLIGDSIVLGGNPYHEEDRLGPQLQRILGGHVWPISAGSWALRNELIYLDRHPDVVTATDRLIFVLNNGDFGEASSWRCEATHPRARPISSVLYVFRKYIWDWVGCDAGPPDNLTVPQGDWRHELEQFLNRQDVRNKSVDIFLYPDQAEMQRQRPLTDLEAHAQEIRRAVSDDRPGHLAIYSVARDARWQASLYRDGIHPTVAGTRVLAQIVASPDKTSALGGRP